MAFKYDIIMDLTEVNRLFGLMDHELSAYNHLVENFGPQFSRDYRLFLEVDVPTLELFGLMCEHNVKIYNMKTDKISPFLSDHISLINTMSSKLKFLLSEAVLSSAILPSIRKFMGMSILKFYVEQSEIRSRNEITKNMEIEYKTIYNNLPKLTNINKKHLQIDRKSCIIQFNNVGNFTSIETPYTKHPLIINDTNLKNKKWNMLILKKDYKVSGQGGGWMVELYNVSPDTYLYKKIDRPTGSYMRF
jgi:hypothetical protein